MISTENNNTSKNSEEKTEHASLPKDSIKLTPSFQEKLNLYELKEYQDHLNNLKSALLARVNFECAKELAPAYKPNLLDFHRKRHSEVSVMAKQLQSVCSIHIATEADVAYFFHQCDNIMQRNNDQYKDAFGKILKDFSNELKTSYDYFNVAIKSISEKNKWRLILFRHLLADAEERITADIYAKHIKLNEDLNTLPTQSASKLAPQTYREFMKSIALGHLSDPALPSEVKSIQDSLHANAVNEVAKLQYYILNERFKRIERNIINKVSDIKKSNCNVEEIAAFFVIQEILTYLTDDLKFEENKLLIQWYLSLPMNDTKKAMSECLKSVNYYNDLNMSELSKIIAEYSINLDIVANPKPTLEKLECALLQSIYKFNNENSRKKYKKISRYVNSEKKLLDYFSKAFSRISDLVKLIQQIERNPRYIPITLDDVANENSIPELVKYENLVQEIENKNLGALIFHTLQTLETMLPELKTRKLKENFGYDFIQELATKVDQNENGKLGATKDHEILKKALLGVGVGAAVIGTASLLYLTLGPAATAFVPMMAQPLNSLIGLSEMLTAGAGVAGIGTLIGLSQKKQAGEHQACENIENMQTLQQTTNTDNFELPNTHAYIHALTSSSEKHDGSENQDECKADLSADSCMDTLEEKGLVDTNRISDQIVQNSVLSSFHLFKLQNHDNERGQSAERDLPHENKDVDESRNREDNRSNLMYA